MQEILELERRIAAALERIDRGVDRIPGASAAPAAAAPTTDAGDELAALRAQLDDERTVSAQLQERLRAIKDRDLVVHAQLQEQIEKMTRQLDVQGLELQRMRKTAISLREQLRVLREAQSAGLAEPHLINKAMLAELDALRATRLTEMAELDEIAAALDAHLTEAENA